MGKWVAACGRDSCSICSESIYIDDNGNEIEPPEEEEMNDIQYQFRELGLEKSIEELMEYINSPVDEPTRYVSYELSRILAQYKNKKSSQIVEMPPRDNTIKEQFKQLGLQISLEELIEFVGNPDEEYLKRVITNLKQTLQEYKDRYPIEPETTDMPHPNTMDINGTIIYLETWVLPCFSDEFQEYVDSLLRTYKGVNISSAFYKAIQQEIKDVYKFFYENYEMIQYDNGTIDLVPK